MLVKILKCPVCGQRAVPLGGYGEACIDGDCTGRFDRWEGETREFPDAEHLEDKIPEALLVDGEAD